MSSSLSDASVLVAAIGAAGQGRLGCCFLVLTLNHAIARPYKAIMACCYSSPSGNESASFPAGVLDGGVIFPYFIVRSGIVPSVSNPLIALH